MKKRDKAEKLSNLYRHASSGEKLTFCVVSLLSLIALVYCAARGDILNISICLTVIASMFVPRLLEWLFQIRFTQGMRITIMLFIAVGCLGGSILEFYTRFSQWDTVLHLGCGFGMALVGYFLPDVLNHRASGAIHTGYRILSAFVFALAAAAFWELFEYSADRIFGTDMQADAVIHVLHSKFLGPSPYTVETMPDIREVTVNGQELGLGGWLEIGLYDTMHDIFANAAGALAYCGLSLCVLKKPDSALSRFLHPRYVWEENTAEE